MKTTAIAIAHEICREIDACCVMCGETFTEIHHSPKRHKRGAAPEVLYITLWPVCKKCHSRDPVIDIGLSLQIESGEMWGNAMEHIARCVARNVYCGK